LKEFSKDYYLYTRYLLFIFFSNYIEVKETKKSVVAKNNKEDDKKVF